MPCKSFNPIFLNGINIFYHYLYFILSESAILGFDFFRLVHKWLGFCLYLFPPNKFWLNSQFLWKCKNPVKKLVSTTEIWELNDEIVCDSLYSLSLILFSGFWLLILFSSFYKIYFPIFLQNLNYGSVWIELIVVETENWNWKYYSKIIFKCVNSIVGPIFNEKVAEKWNLWVHEQCTDALFMEDLVKCCGWIKKKKKEKKRKGKTRKNKRTVAFSPIQTGTILV